MREREKAGEGEEKNRGKLENFVNKVHCCPSFPSVVAYKMVSSFLQIHAAMSKKLQVAVNHAP